MNSCLRYFFSLLSFICHSVLWIKLTETLPLDSFCQTKGFSMARSELIHKEIIVQTSKKKEQKHKDNLKHKIYSLLQ